MKQPFSDCKEVTKCLSRLRYEKAPWSDSLRPEFYKAMDDSETSLDVTTECLKKRVGKGGKTEEWKCLLPFMIPKADKSKSMDLRPMALTNESYKIFVSTEDEMDEWTEWSEAGKDTQNACTEGRRIEESIFILQCCVENCFKRKSPLSLP